MNDELFPVLIDLDYLNGIPLFQNLLNRLIFKVFLSSYWFKHDLSHFQRSGTSMSIKSEVIGRKM